MFLSQRDHHRLLAAAVFLFTFFQHVNGLAMKYCSSLNTASTNANSSIYQSDGLCYNFCVDSYAFAVVQGSDCWCSNYVPGPTTSTDDCANPCPGYPTDTCGGDNTYGYIPLRLSPSGTKGAATTAAASTTLQVRASIPPTACTQTFFFFRIYGPVSSFFVDRLYSAFNGNSFDFLSMTGNYFERES
ncbi:cell wall integrity and stress response component protein [Rutstroemia sp. NJR-2017a WRK4]|nr:cell wall integrity and stress response component protein [Rutstroemia sp. NJR-2017a WRK4]